VVDTSVASTVDGRRRTVRGLDARSRRLRGTVWVGEKGTVPVGKYPPRAGGWNRRSS
jgi:hypothetical protein